MEIRTGRYIVVTDDDYQDFIQEVNDRIAEGWKLQGGVSVTALSGGDDVYRRYFQAMIKDDGAVSIR